MPTWLIEEPETLIVPGLVLLAIILAVSKPRVGFALLLGTMLYNAYPQNNSAPSRVGDLYLPASEMTHAGTIASPDGRWMAARFYRAGGGGFSPYCYEAVNVFSVSNGKPTYNRNDLLYAANCEDLELEWLSDSNSKSHWLGGTIRQ